jgi:hypothetical protein
MGRLLEDQGLSLVRAEAVRHEEFGLRFQLRAAVAAACFAGLTLGASTALPWQSFNHAIRKGNPALPPSTLSLERDHLFIVARKQ